MIKVAYVGSTLKRCGPTQQLLYIIRNLDRTLFDPLVITLSPEPVDSIADRFREEGIRVLSLNLSRMAGLFLAKSSLMHLLKQEKVDLLHTQGLRADSMAASLRNEWPAVCSLRNFPQLDYPMTYGSLRGRWMAYVHAHALARVHAPVGVSSAVSSNLKEVFGVCSGTVCNGVDTNAWVPASSEQQSKLRIKLNIPEEGRLWVSVGHLSARKNPLMLVDAFKTEALGKNHRLVFLGNGPLEEPVRAAARSCSNILTAGRVENVSEYLHAADAFVSASTAEGFPNAALEALSCGVPCVLSDIPPHREIADSAGSCVSLFSGNDIEQLIAAVKNQGLSEESRCNARVAAEKHFSAAVMSGRYQEIYKKTLRDCNYD